MPPAAPTKKTQESVQHPIPQDVLTARAASLTYCTTQLQWAFTPLAGKRPMRPNWQAEPPLPLSQLLNHPGNIGLRTGTASGIVVVDLDPGCDPEALTDLAGHGAPLPDTVEVKTGRGRHLYYSHPAPLKNSAGKLGKHIDIRADGGQVVFPGSIHPETHEIYEFSVAPWEICPSPLPEWIVEKLTDPKQAPAAPMACQSGMPSSDKPGNSPDKPASIQSRARLYVSKMDPAIAGQNGHNQTWRVVMTLLEAWDLPIQDARPILYEYNSRCVPPWSQQELEHKLADGLTKITPARRGRLANAPDPHKIPLIVTEDPNSRRATAEYILTPGQHTDATQTTIEQSSADFSSHVLARLPADILYLKSTIPGEILGDPGRRRWSELTADRGRLLIDSNVKLKAWAHGALQFRPCNKDQAGLVLAGAANHPHARPLDLMVSYPVYSRDWQLIQPGWHDGIYYDEPEELQNLTPERDIDAIHETLSTLVTDFPFANPAADRQNYFGLLLTPMIAHAAGGNRPLHLIQASRPRTGKSKLAEIIFGGLYIGGPTPAMQITGSDEERDKRILALLLEGDTLIHLDNIPKKIDSAAIASLLTTRFYRGRILGISKMLTLPNNLTLVASGNNTEVTDEIAKRVIPIVLQPTDSNPEYRTNFQHADLPEHVRTQRREILQCLIGMIENWKDAGRPRGRKPLGGFEGWAQAVGGILAVNAMNDWRANETQWREGADAEETELLTFVKCWWANVRSARATPRTLLQIAEHNDLFESIMSRNTERARVSAMGQKLRNYIDTPIGSWIIRRSESGGHAVYSLVENAPGAGGPALGEE